LIAAVPGLVDDPAQNVRRDKFRMIGAEVSKIFEPVIQEVVILVKKQITSTSKKIKTMLMMSEFDQNAYLREIIRASIDFKIEVMQPSND
jgi:protein-arginine kinase activator protein McsA